MNESFDTYLKKDGISASDLRRFKISPMHYKAYKSDIKEQEKETKAMILGSCIHTFLLEKELFFKRYICLKKDMLPAKTKNGEKNYTLKENREYRDNFAIIHNTKTVIDEADYDLVLKVCNTAYNDINVRYVFKTGRAEVSTYKIDEKTGITKKGRADWVPEHIPCIVDFKSCMDSSPKVFIRQIFSSGYNNQGAWYLDLFDREKFLFFALEKEEPFICETYNLTDEVINYSKDENRMLLDIFYWSKKNNFWANYSQFEALKTIYKERVLYHKNIQETCDELDIFLQSDKPIVDVKLPSWI